MIFTGDALETLATFCPDESVQCCVTSPPYWGLRDYGVQGQLGLEKTPQEYIENLVAVFREVRRVLKNDGTLWLNLGDSYAGSWGSQGRQGKTGELAGRTACAQRQIAVSAKKQSLTGSTKHLKGIKAKDLVGIPWMAAFALRSDGWYLRQDLIWHKPNPMPESVVDRCTKAHEYLFLLSKKPIYYFDHKAMQEPAAWPGGPRDKKGYAVAGQRDGANANLGGNVHKIGPRETRNRRSVWSVTTKAFRGAHFATFPPDLIEPCILAGSRPGDVILDPFFGAGTTGVVAQKHSRHYLGIELNPAYVELAKTRLEKVK